MHGKGYIVGKSSSCIRHREGVTEDSYAVFCAFSRLLELLKLTNDNYFEDSGYGYLVDCNHFSA